MCSISKLDLFTAYTNGDMCVMKDLPADVDFNDYFTIETLGGSCLCHVEFELFRGTAEEMISKYGDAVASGKCEHFGRSTLDDNENQVMAKSAYSDYMIILKSDLIENKSIGGLNALQIGVLFGHMNMVEWLISTKGADVHSVTKQAKETTLNLAAIRGAVDMVKFLQEKGVPIDRYSEIINNSPAVYATHFNHVDLLEYLIEHDADLNHEGSMFETPLTDAFRTVKTKCVELLLKAGIEIDGVSNNLLFKSALEEDQTDMAKVFLNFIDTNYQHEAYYDRRDTPLLVACKMENVEMIKLLVEKGANVNADIGEEDSVLHFAVEQNWIEVTEQLLQSGSLVNKNNIRKYAPLHFAAWDGSLEICKLLLAHDAEYDTQTIDKNTPLGLACHGNHLDVIELLLPLKCDVNPQDKDLDTPLLYTTFNGNLQATQLLLQHGADPQLMNRFDTTPIWNAVYSQNEELIQLLLELNVSLNCETVGINQHAQQADVVPIYIEPKSLLYVACDQCLVGVPTHLVLAGFDLSKESWAHSNQLPKYFALSPTSRYFIQIMEEIHSLTSDVRSLKQACRINIRRMLKHHLPRDVSRLGLPSLLQDYVSCKEWK